MGQGRSMRPKALQAAPVIRAGAILADHRIPVTTKEIPVGLAGPHLGGPTPALVPNQAAIALRRPYRPEGR